MKTKGFKDSVKYWRQVKKIQHTENRRIPKKEIKGSVLSKYLKLIYKETFLTTTPPQKILRLYVKRTH